MRANGAEAPKAPQETFLVADIGHSTTTAVLFDIVEEAYRFVARGEAPTTLEGPWFDVIRGVQQAIANISETTGRTLLTSQGTLITPSRADGTGVDHFAASASVGAPLATVVVGLLEDVSLASARRVMDTIYAREVDHFSLNDSRGQQAQIDAILHNEPDLIFIGGGTNEGAQQRVMKLVETVGLGIGMLDGRKPRVVFAGNTSLRQRVTETLSGVTHVTVAENIRPTLEVEQPDDAARTVAELYEELKLSAVPGLEEVANWSSHPLVPTSRAFAKVIEYFAALYQGHVVGVDVGSDSLTFVSADRQQSRMAVRSDLGVGRPLGRLAGRIEPAAISQWLPMALEAGALRNFLQDKALHPRTVATSEEELYLEQAVIRELIRETVRRATAGWEWSARGLPRFKLLLARGNSLANAPRPGQSILMLLDALQPTGIFSVAVDRHGVLPAIGVLAPHEPLVGVQALEGGVLVELGWVIAPAGRAGQGQPVMSLRMETEHSGAYDAEVEYGSLEVLPLAPDEKAELTIKPTRRFDVGFGPGKGHKVKVHGGAVGLVIDARGRPIQTPKDEVARQSLVRHWLWDMGG
jgi:hypothetical protein